MPHPNGELGTEIEQLTELGVQTVNSNNVHCKWFDLVVYAVFVIVMFVWWVHFRLLPHTDPWRGIVLHVTLFLVCIYSWLNAYYRRINASRWSFWSSSFVAGFSIPVFIVDFIEVNHIKTLSPLDSIVFIIFGLLTSIGLGFLAEKRRR